MDQIEKALDNAAVDTFAAAMKRKLAVARAKGRGGWQRCSREELSRMLREHVDKGDARDVANFCMFLWSLGHGIAPAPQQVIDMILYCPNCGEQHVDADESNNRMHSVGCNVSCGVSGGCSCGFKDLWTNPPHRSHLCHKCGTIWRPADVATNGVASIKTAGKDDKWVAHPQEITAMGARDLAIEALESAQNGLRWYQNHNTDAVNSSDDEMDELIERALAALKGPRKPEMDIKLGEPVLQTDEYKGASAAFNSAINFAIQQGVEAATFLDAWRHGDTSEWPDFVAAPKTGAPHGRKET